MRWASLCCHKSPTFAETNDVQLASFFYSIYRYLKEHRTVFFITVPLLFMLLAYWASRIQFEEDVTKLIPASEGSAHVSEVLRSANFADKTVINISASDMGDIDALKAYADSFAMAIRHAAAPYIARGSEARRVGKECVSTCRSRWARYH